MGKINTVAIIGGGVSGLSAGGVLARNGLTVKLFEANDKLGGCSANTNLGGYTFHDGAMYLAFRGVLDHVFEKLGLDRSVVLPSFVGLMFMAAVFFGPSFAMTQALATLRMRSVATSVLLFIQTLIGNGLGPSVTGLISDRLNPSFHQNSLRYALVMIGVVNVWAAVHYLMGSRTLRQDLEATEKLAAA